MTFKQWVSVNIGSQTQFARLLNISIPTARKYLNNPEAMQVRHIFHLERKTGKSLQDVVRRNRAKHLNEE